MPPKQKRAKKQAAAAVAPQAGRAASTAGLKHGQHRAKLLEAFDFEVSQGLKARLQGWRSKSVVFKHRYDEAGISVSELFARSIRMFGPREQDTALATDQALVELSKAGLPLIALDVIRRFLGERLAWDPQALIAAGRTKKQMKKRCPGFLHRLEIAGRRKNHVLRLPFDEGWGSTWGGSYLRSRLLERIAAVEDGDLEAAAARTRATLGLPDPIDTSEPHTLVIKVVQTHDIEGYQSGECVGLLRVPNDACASNLTNWCTDLGLGRLGYASMYHLKVTDRAVVRARQEVLQHAARPRRNCCAAAMGDVRQWDYIFDSSSRDRALEELTWHVAGAPFEHSDILDRLQAFDRDHCCEVDVDIALTDGERGNRHRQFGDICQSRPGAHSGDVGEDDPAPTVPLMGALHGSRAALCEKVGGPNPDELCQCCETSTGRCIRYFSIEAPCAIQDVLPTMAETRQPSRCPAATLLLQNHSWAATSAPTAELHDQNYSGNGSSCKYSRYGLTVIAHEARLPSSAYPKLAPKGNVSAATPTW